MHARALGVVFKSGPAISWLSPTPSGVFLVFLKLRGGALDHSPVGESGQAPGRGHSWEEAKDGPGDPAPPFQRPFAVAVAMPLRCECCHRAARARNRIDSGPTGGIADQIRQLGVGVSPAARQAGRAAVVGADMHHAAQARKLARKPQAAARGGAGARLDWSSQSLGGSAGLRLSGAPDGGWGGGGRAGGAVGRRTGQQSRFR